MPVTQHDIAAKLGVSRQAVTFAMSDHPERHRQLRPETRRRILETAQEMGYVPDLAARRLGRHRGNAGASSFDQVGLIYLSSVDVAVDPVCLIMMSGAEREVSHLHAALTFVRVGEEEDWAKVDRLTQSGSIDGWLVYGPAGDKAIERLKLTGHPFVILGDHRGARPVHDVNVDNAAAGRLAVEHLAALGHRRIAFLGGGLEHQYETETLGGFRAALKEFRLEDDKSLIRHVSLWDVWEGGQFWAPGNARHLLSWLRTTSATAVFAAELDFADSLYQVLKQAGIDVPGDISIVGLESLSQAARSRNFSRIEPPLAEVGRRGALLLHRIVSEPGMATADVRIAPSLVEGWSTAQMR